MPNTYILRVLESMFARSSQIETMGHLHLRDKVQTCCFPRRLGCNQRGFTLVELVMTMVIVGIIAVVAAPRLLGTSVFKSRGYADQVQASLRYAQKEAIAQHRNVCVAFTTSSVTLTIGPTTACGTPLLSPTGGAYVVTAPAGITFAALPAAFSFNALGQPNPNTAQTINISGAANAITIEAETGYVHSP
jgi:MSHA pilin protein MshC